MFDLKAEISKYEIIMNDVEYSDNFMILNKTIENFQASLKRSSKEHIELNAQLEELLDMIQNHEDILNAQIEEVKASKKHKIEASSLINAIIAIMDEIENIYRLSQKHEMEISMQYSSMWTKLINILSKAGIAVVGLQRDIFNSNYYTVLGITYDKDFDNEMVVEVVNSGYVYNGEIIRRASVIVNKIERIEER